MGFKKQLLSSKTYNKTNKGNLQNYYTELYQTSVKQLLQEGHDKRQIDNTLLSIFSRTKIPTKTNSNRLLKLLDIDKIISINQSSLKQNSEQIKHMRMIASIKHSSQNEREQRQGTQEIPTHINELVRLARMHMLQQANRRRDEESEEEDETHDVNPRLERLREIRLERLRVAWNNNTNTTNVNDNTQ